MENGVWSTRLAAELAAVLGPGPSDSGRGAWPESVRGEADRLVAELGDGFRHLPAVQINQAFAFAHFLAAQTAPPRKGSLDQLRQLGDYVAFLRERYGLAVPADESADWTEEDERDLNAATWSRLEEPSWSDTGTR